MEKTETTQPVTRATQPPTNEKHGQELLAKVNARKQELTAALSRARSATPKGVEETQRAADIEKAMAAIGTLLTGDLAQIDDANAAELELWLETSAVLTSGKPTAKG